MPPAGGGAANVPSSNVNKAIQSLALKYCSECKSSFDELSKIIQVQTNFFLLNGQILQIAVNFTLLSRFVIKKNRIFSNVQMKLVNSMKKHISIVIFIEFQTEAVG